MQPLTTLTPTPPYAFARIAAVLRRFDPPVLDSISADGAYWRALAAGDGVALLRVSPTLEVHIMAQTGQPDMAEAVRLLNTVLATDIDPTGFYAAAQADPVLWALLRPLIGVRWLRSASVFEALVMVIIEQHITWTAALRAQRWLVRWGGTGLSAGAGVTHYTFPTAARLAAASSDDLKPLKITTRRVETIRTLARQVAAGALDLEALRGLPAAEAYAALLALPGVGHWTAANVVLRTQGVFYAVPDTDVALQRAANVYFNGVDARLSAPATRALFAAYGAHGAAAAYHTLLRWVLDRYPVAMG